MFLEFDYYQEAKPFIEEAAAIFKQKEQFLNVIECDLFLIAVDLELNEEFNF